MPLRQPRASSARVLRAPWAPDGDQEIRRFTAAAGPASRRRGADDAGASSVARRREFSAPVTQKPMGRGRQGGAVHRHGCYTPARTHSPSRGTGSRSAAAGSRRARSRIDGALCARVPYTLLALVKGITEGNPHDFEARAARGTSSRSSDVPLAPSRIGAFHERSQHQGARSRIARGTSTEQL